METINISFIFFEKDVNYTKDIMQEIEYMYKNDLIYCTPCKECFIFSSSEISKKEGLILEKIINTDNGYDMLVQHGIKTDIAEYNLATVN